MEVENQIENLNNFIENVITVQKSKTINALERLRVKYLGKLEMIEKQIKKTEERLLSELSNELSEAQPIELIEKKQRGRPKKIYPTILPEIINDVIIDTYETQLDPLILSTVVFTDNCIPVFASEFSIE